MSETAEEVGGEIVRLTREIDLIEVKRVQTNSDTARLTLLRSELRKAQREMTRLKANLPVLPGF